MERRPMRCPWGEYPDEATPKGCLRCLHGSYCVIFMIYQKLSHIEMHLDEVMSK